MKVSFIGDPRAKTDASGKKKIPRSSKYLKFKRVYGFKNKKQVPDGAYFGSFQVSILNGEKIIVLNNFRDSSFFSSPFYSISIATIENNMWSEIYSSDSLAESMYQVAIGTRGQILTGSFYGNKLLFFEPEFGKSLDKHKIIE